MNKKSIYEALEVQDYLIALRGTLLITAAFAVLFAMMPKPVLNKEIEMPHLNHACQNEAVARAVCDAIVKRGQDVVAITVSAPGYVTVWYRCIEDQQIVEKVRGEIAAAESHVLRLQAA